MKRLFSALFFLIIFQFFLFPEFLSADDNQKEIEILLKDSLKFQAPSEFCQLRQTHTGEGDTLIIHIQDAHTNLSGQQNLAKTLDFIFSRYGIYLVLVEGGSIDGTLDPLKTLAPQKEISRVAKNFLIQGRLSGEEYLNLTSNHPMKIIGIEDQRLYDENVRVYASLAARRQPILAYLKKIQHALNKLKSKLYPKDILEYEKQTSRLKADRSFSQTDVLKLLDLARRSRAPLKEFANLRKLKSLKKSEDISKIDLDGLLREQELLEEKIYLSRLTTDDSRLVRVIDKYLELLFKAYRIQLNSGEFEALEANENDFPMRMVVTFINQKLAELGYGQDLLSYELVVDDAAGYLHEFYDLVNRRDLAFIQNTERILREKNKSTAILITGGYHTQHLTQLMDQKGYSYVVLTPKVTSETNHEKYEKILLGG
jgi:hypothetical protein